MTKKAKHYEISSKLIGASSINGLLLRFLISIFSEFTLMWTGCQGIPKVSLRLQSGPKGEHDVLLLLLFCFFAQARDIKSSQNDQKNAKNYQISSKLFGASAINGLLAPISYFHLQ